MNEHEFYNYKLIAMFGNNFGKGYYSKNMLLIRFMREILLFLSLHMILLNTLFLL